MSRFRIFRNHGRPALTGLALVSVYPETAMAQQSADNRLLIASVILALIGLLAVGIVIVWRMRVETLLRRTQELEDRVRQRTEALQLATEELHFLALHDELTGLVNQRGFWQHADKLEMEARVDETMFGLVLIDLDFFKKINDQYGHRTGDEVLRHAAMVMQRVCQEDDKLCRYGGEEFAILVANTDPDRIRSLAEKIRAEIEATDYVHVDERVPYTASFGISYWLKGKDNVEAMFGRADRAMYEAKESRNSWMMWNPAMDYDPGRERA